VALKLALAAAVVMAAVATVAAALAPQAAATQTLASVAPVVLRTAAREKVPR